MKQSATERDHNPDDIIAAAANQLSEGVIINLPSSEALRKRDLKSPLMMKPCFLQFDNSAQAKKNES
jgi:hypothetical protein